MEDSTSASGSESVELNNSLQVIVAWPVMIVCKGSNFLNSFRAPKLSDLTRKRAAHRNAHTSATTPAKRKSKPSCSTEPKSVTPMQRVREFPREELTQSAGKLFCNASREELLLKLSIIKLHITSGKYLAGKVALARREARECVIAKSLELYDKQECPSGQNLPEAQRVFCVKVYSKHIFEGWCTSKQAPLLPGDTERTRLQAGRSARDA